jgi:hypothetical protein
MSMNVNVYLPDELGEKAKAGGLNFSRLLRDTIEHRLALVERHRDEPAIAAALKNAATVELAVENENGDVYTLEFVGVPLSERVEDVYLAEDGRVVVYEDTRQKVWIVEDPVEELRKMLTTDEYVSTLGMLGHQPRLTLDDLGG